MVLGILTKLAGFSVKNPKTVGIIAMVILAGAFGVHYKLLVGERDKLRVAEEGYKIAVTAFVQREETLQLDILLERAAAQMAVVDRDAANAALEDFRDSRDDEESIEWASKQIPIGEVERLCVALPEMVGCGE